MITDSPMVHATYCVDYQQHPIESNDTNCESYNSMAGVTVMVLPGLSANAYMGIKTQTCELSLSKGHKMHL